MPQRNTGLRRSEVASEGRDRSNTKSAATECEAGAAASVARRADSTTASAAVSANQRAGPLVGQPETARAHLRDEESVVRPILDDSCDLAASVIASLGTFIAYLSSP